MAKTKKEKENEGLDLIENPDAVLSKAEEFLSEKKNQQVVSYVLGAMVLVLAGFLYWNYSQGNKEAEAQEEMYQAIYYFEADSLGLALNGDGNNYGFVDISDIYSGTPSANLSQFYIGSIYLKLAEYESAIRAFNNFSSSDELIQGRAYSLIGDAYVELDDFENAIANYRKAVEYRPNEDFTPTYMMKLALAIEKSGDLNGAIAVYEDLLTEYPTVTQFQDAKKYMALLEGQLAE